MLYAIYKPDGSIIQATKAWNAADATDEFEDGLRALGQKFIKKESAYVLSPDVYYVDVKAEELVARPVMPIEVSKLHIRAGGDDSVLISGIPAAARYRIAADGTEYASGQLDADGTEIELSVPIACTCTVTLEKWPYRTFITSVAVHP
jgi:hypothetical protein